MDVAVELQPTRPPARSKLADDGVVIDAGPALTALILDELGYAADRHGSSGAVPLYGSLIVPDDRSSSPRAKLVADPRRRRAAAHRPPLADGRSTCTWPSTPRASSRSRSSAVASSTRPTWSRSRPTPASSSCSARRSWRSPGCSHCRPPSNGRAIGGRPVPTPGPPTRLSPTCPASPRRAGGPARAGAALAQPRPGGRHAGGAGQPRRLQPRRRPRRRVPPLSVTARHHYPALFAALMQTDLATIVDSRGIVGHIGVGLYSSAEADAAVDTDRGMRHPLGRPLHLRPPQSVAVVVSEDGPVTVFHRALPLRVRAGLGTDVQRSGQLNRPPRLMPRPSPCAACSLNLEPRCPRTGGPPGRGRCRRRAPRARLPWPLTTSTSDGRTPSSSASRRHRGVGPAPARARPSP